LTEDEAFKMVTLNPARLYVDDRVEVLKWKDADLVLWSDNPRRLCKANKTIVDGIVYFDRDRDKELRKQISIKRNRRIKND
jgi:imidazolonepropionase-like amidohydrolase